MQNNWLEDMRRHTSPIMIGLLVARLLKPPGITREEYLDKYAQRQYETEFKNLTDKLVS
jgi:hypothetical protein